MRLAHPDARGKTILKRSVTLICVALRLAATATAFRWAA
jgi:hypothetical protein